MSEQANRPKSLREFDYFKEDAVPEAGGPVGGSPWGRARDLLYALLGRGRSDTAGLGMGMVAVLVCGWFVWGLRGWIAYSFSPAGEPLELGEVTTMKSADIPHNAYVAVAGVTAHRGYTQRAVRGLSLQRQEWWHFRLVGTEGVFIAVPPDRTKYGIDTALRVEGRSVDPRREACCDQVLAAYAERAPLDDARDLRFILVGERPGENRWSYGGLLLIFAGLSVSVGLRATRVLRRLVRRIRHA